MNTSEGSTGDDYFNKAIMMINNYYLILASMTMIMRNSSRSSVSKERLIWPSMSVSYFLGNFHDRGKSCVGQMSQCETWDFQGDDNSDVLLR
jgi:hypothetical protein